MFANCAAMGIPPPVARDMTLWDYEATLVNWNRQHDTDPDPEPATVDEFKETVEFFEANPQLLN